MAIVAKGLTNLESQATDEIKRRCSNWDFGKKSKNAMQFLQLYDLFWVFLMKIQRMIGKDFFYKYVCVC